jgi:hypothetical protein
MSLLVIGVLIMRARKRLRHRTSRHLS